MRLRTLASSLLLVFMFLSCGRDPEVTFSIPECDILEVRDITSRSAVVVGVVRNLIDNHAEFILRTASKEEKSYHSVPDSSGRIEWMLEGLSPGLFYTVTFEISSHSNTTTSEPVSFQTIGYCDIKDHTIKDYCIRHYDINGDGILTEDESPYVTVIDTCDVHIESLNDLRNFPNLEILRCENDGAGGVLDLKSNTMLHEIRLGGNKLNVVKLDHNPALEILDLHDNLLESISLSGAPGIKELNINNVPLGSFDLSGELFHLAQLEKLQCRNCGQKRLWLTSCIRLNNIDCADNIIQSIDLTGIYSDIEYLCLVPQKDGYVKTIYIRDGQEIKGLTVDRDCSSVSTDTKIESKVIFDDSAFEYYCIRSFDLDKDEILSCSEAAAVKVLDLQGLGIKSLTGIEHFTGLTDLFCDDNKLTGVLDLNNNRWLEQVYLRNNSLEEVRLDNHLRMRVLALDNMSGIRFSLEGMPHLLSLGIDGTDIGSSFINNELRHAPDLINLTCRGCDIDKLDLSGLPALASLDCQSNRIKVLDISHNAELFFHLGGCNLQYNDMYNGYSKIDTVYTRPGQVIQEIYISPGVQFNLDDTVIVSK